MNNVILSPISLDELKNLFTEFFKTEMSSTNKKTDNSDSDSLLTRDEASDYLKISKPTLDKATKEGSIICHRLKGSSRKLYKLSDLNNCLVKVKTFN
jgi:excisionase family DNA binding protein